jgi:hypothetical protein
MKIQNHLRKSKLVTQNMIKQEQKNYSKSLKNLKDRIKKI